MNFAGGVSAVSAEQHPKADEVNGEASSAASGAWESKLSDVVKGVAKIGKSGRESHSQAQKPLLNGPPAAAVSMAAVVAPSSSISKASIDQNPLPNGDLAQSTLALTPPTSPGKKERGASLHAADHRRRHPDKSWPGKERKKAEPPSAPPLNS